MVVKLLPLLLGDDEDVIEEEEVHLLLTSPSGEEARLLYIGCQLSPFQQPP